MGISSTRTKSTSVVVGSTQRSNSSTPLYSSIEQAEGGTIFVIYKERSSVNFEKSFRRDNMFSILSQECEKTSRIPEWVV